MTYTMPRSRVVADVVLVGGPFDGLHIEATILGNGKPADVIRCHNGAEYQRPRHATDGVWRYRFDMVRP